MTTTRTFVATALVAVLVAAIALLWWQRPADPARPVAPAASASQTAPASRVEPPADVRTPAPQPAPRADLQEGLRVFVKDRARQPVAGATITVTGEDSALVFPPTAADGWTRTDRLPNGRIALAARQADRSGLASWRPTPTMTSEVTITLNSDRDVEVKVVAPGDTPVANAVVRLLGEKEEPSSRGQQATTDDTGVARFRLAGHTWLAAHEKIRAVASVDGAQVAAEPIAWSEPGPTVVTIAVERAPAPRQGPELCVRFVEPNGGPADVRGTLEWSHIVSSGSKTVDPWYGEVAAAGTEARVAPLADGAHLRLALQEDGRLLTELEVTLPAGVLRHEATLVRGLASPRLEIPLVDGAGRPVTTGQFVVTVLQPMSRSRGGYELETTMQPDADGLLVVTLADAVAGSVEVAEPFDAARLQWPARQRLKRPYRTMIGTPPPPNPPLAVLEFATCASGEVRRLPAVAVPDSAPRLAGSVVDDDGKPVPGVAVLITTTTAPEPAEFAAFMTRTDARGQFAIRATSLPDEVFVCGRKPLGFCAPLRVRPSATPVTLRLQRTGTIALDLPSPQLRDMPPAMASRLRRTVALRVDEGALVDGWWAFYRERPTFFVGKWRWSALAAVPEQGELLLRNLVPGSYEVAGSVGEQTAWSLPAVRVAAGETTRPPEARGLAFDNAVPARVRVHDGTGAPVANARVRLVIAGEKDRTSRTDASGDAWFVVPRGAAASVEVNAERCTPASVRTTTFPLEVAIGPGTSFDVQLTGHAAAASGSRVLVVVCRRFDGAPPDSPVQRMADIVGFAHPQANVGEDGRCTIPALTPGNYRLWLGAVRPIGANPPHTFVALGDRKVTEHDAARVRIEHAVTAAETATLLGR